MAASAPEIMYSSSSPSGCISPLCGASLVISGAQDDAWVLGASRVLAERIPGARLVLLDGARHHPQEDQPEAFAKALLDFLMVADRAD